MRSTKTKAVRSYSSGRRDSRSLSPTRSVCLLVVRTRLKSGGHRISPDDAGRVDRGTVIEVEMMLQPCTYVRPSRKPFRRKRVRGLLPLHSRSRGSLTSHCPYHLRVASLSVHRATSIFLTGCIVSLSEVFVASIMEDRQL